MGDFIPKIKIKGGKNITINLNNIEPNTKIKAKSGENITINLNDPPPDTKIVVRDTKNDVKININSSNDIGQILAGTEDETAIGDCFNKKCNKESPPA